METLITRERKNNGEEHPELAIIYWHAANVLKTIDRPLLAAEKRQQTLELETRSTGPAHPETLSTACSLAEDWLAAGEREKAAAVITQARADAEQGEASDEMEEVIEMLRELASEVEHS